jgi:1-acyl-sn-glycerol-3-phosphate acyltransferase
MRLAVVCWKLLRALMHAVGGWFTIRFRFSRMSPQAREQEVQRWSRKMLQILGVTLVVQGRAPEHGPLLLIVNHVSWLDILCIHAARHVRFVAKSNIRHWPMLGSLSTGAGTLYIERERRRDAMRLVHHMADALRAGDLIAVFPEGTTSDGRTLLPFHANLLQSAISAGAPVQPAALRFALSSTGETSSAPAYVDDDSLLDSVWRTLSAPPLTAYLRFGDPQDSRGRERRAWAMALHTEVSALRAHTYADAAPGSSD